MKKHLIILLLLLAILTFCLCLCLPRWKTLLSGVKEEPEDIEKRIEILRKLQEGNYTKQEALFLVKGDTILEHLIDQRFQE